MKTRFILFTKDSCGPCGLVKRYFNALDDDRTKLIEEVHLEDFSDEPIPEENIEIARKYASLPHLFLLSLMRMRNFLRLIQVVCQSPRTSANSLISTVYSF